MEEASPEERSQIVEDAYKFALIRDIPEAEALARMKLLHFRHVANNPRSDPAKLEKLEESFYDICTDLVAGRMAEKELYADMEEMIS